MADESGTQKRSAPSSDDSIAKRVKLTLDGQAADDMSEKLDKATTRISTLEKGLLAALARLEQTNTGLSGAHRLINRLETDLSTTNERINELEGYVDEALDRLEDVETELPTAKERVNELEENTNVALNHLEEVESDLSIAKDDLVPSRRFNDVANGLSKLFKRDVVNIQTWLLTVETLVSQAVSTEYRGERAIDNGAQYRLIRRDDFQVWYECNEVSNAIMDSWHFLRNGWHWTGIEQGPGGDVDWPMWEDPDPKGLLLPTPSIRVQPRG